MTSRRRAAALTAVLSGLVLSLLVALVPPAGAAANGDWSVFPTTDPDDPRPRSDFNLSLKPGVVYDDSVTVGNETDAPLRFYLYAADAYNTESGGFSLVNRFEPAFDMGSWVELPFDELEVPANSEIDVPFTITVPADAEPGDHVGGIVAENVDVEAAELDQEGVGLSISQAVGTRIYGRVEGPIEASLVVTDMKVTTENGIGTLSGGQVRAGLEIKIVNDGNLRQTPAVRATLSPLLGSTIQLDTIVIPEILPNGSATIRYPAVAIRPFGRIKGTAEVFGPDASTSAATTEWVIPWGLLAVIGLIIAGFVLYRWRRRRAAAGPVGDDPPDDADDPPDDAEDGTEERETELVET